MSQPDSSSRIVLGWREWLALPELGIARIKAKVDTGARTSALHAFEVEEIDRNGVPYVSFSIHPRQYDTDLVLVCEAPIKDRRTVTDSGGHREQRIVIETPVEIAGNRWPIELTLTARDDMRFRMLLGRSAIRGIAMVDPGTSYRTRKKKKKHRRQEAE